MMYAIALTLLPSITPAQQLSLLRHFHDAEAILLRPEESLRGVNEGTRVSLIKTIKAGRDAAIRRAEYEWRYCQAHDIQVLPYGSEGYPTRLLDCPDAPVVLYYRGNVSLNSKHIVAVVGTRKITEYGKQICHRLTEDLAHILPDTIVISGLAYGVDIHAHRGCLQQGLSTIGVVAHGLDRIYPDVHRNDARKMVSNGGILTEYIRGTEPLRGNFLRRNRIVAGMADATIIVESASHGGSLVTARIAHSYDRAVYAYPGRINDPYSAGCNALLQQLKASAILSAETLVHDMGWWEDSVPYKSQAQQLELFNDVPRESDDHSPQSRIIAALQGSDGMNAATLSARTGMSPTDLSNLLFDMEMDGIVKILPGGQYILTR